MHRWERIGNYRYRCKRCKVMRRSAWKGWRYFVGDKQLPMRPECVVMIGDIPADKLPF